CTMADHVERIRVWVHDKIQRCSEFAEFHHLLQELRLDDQRFQRYFRVTQAQFNDLLSRIGVRITYEDTNYRHSISAAERLSICILPLVSYRTIGSSFRVGFMAVPTAEEWRSIAEEFEELWNFPLCLGAVDGKHIRLKGGHYLVLHAVIDARYRFRVIDVGRYGRTSDGGILANSAFGQALREGTLQLPPNQQLPGADHRGPQPHVFVADEAFPLQRHMMRPYCERTRARGGLTPEERIFNYRLSRVAITLHRARLVVEDAFVFCQEVEIHPETAKKCMKATCLLHNFMRAIVASHAPALRAAGAQEEERLPDVRRVGANNASQEAMRLREVFKAHLCVEGVVPWQLAD
uniref:DDE Tnp4 domain-containing protein n=1 Tax=Periophthalmus magnuspinnatus TaxID=409849 RepID=A0A3B4BHK8_9GOBI